MKRRHFLIGIAAATSLAGLPNRSEADELRLALTSSDLVYLSPVHANGELSSCQAEVWYVMLGADVLVCTDTQSWRAQAPQRGLLKTRLWAGDRGVWRSGEYKSLPSQLLDASIERDETAIEAALMQFELKYASEWRRWGPRFRKGLADGSRTMLRYGLVSA